MKKILVVLLAIALSCSPVLANSDFTKTYESKKGVVTFNHTTHSTSLPDCRVCHSTEVPETIEVTKDLGHKMCKGCHKASLETAPNSPVKCNGCHVKDK